MASSSHHDEDTLPEETAGYKLSQPKQSIAEYQQMGMSRPSVISHVDWPHGLVVSTNNSKCCSYTTTATTDEEAEDGLASTSNCLFFLFVLRIVRCRYGPVFSLLLSLSRRG